MLSKHPAQYISFSVSAYPPSVISPVHNVQTGFSAVLPHKLHFMYTSLSYLSKYTRTEFSLQYVHGYINLLSLQYRVSLRGVAFLGQVHCSTEPA